MKEKNRVGWGQGGRFRGDAIHKLVRGKPGKRYTWDQFQMELPYISRRGGRGKRKSG